ncbi:hypothetical protein [Gracilibacillus thailandensis]|uniref:Uncharacterized protein n=1 Tax=Gracilibacillus thailandensis TaxID=563735 RepID=A0A6N7QVS7_9BACI|nr:hypothetical protein [Gracilibacillus thailandensis]MRI66213.1 hypothetical protein [Gracilibacillus thailandensis]
MNIKEKLANVGTDGIIIALIYIFIPAIFCIFMDIKVLEDIMILLIVIAITPFVYMYYQHKYLEKGIALLSIIAPFLFGLSINLLITSDTSPVFFTIIYITLFLAYIISFDWIKRVLID